MVKIVHVAKPIGGVGVYIALLSKHLNNNNFKNILLCNLNDKIAQIEDPRGNQLDTYNININREINIFNDIKCLFIILKHLKSIKPDIIHCHSAKAGILGRIAGLILNIPAVYTPHAYSYLSSQSIIGRMIYKKIEQLFRIFPSKTLACSMSEYKRTINDLKFNSKKVFLWNNSIESEFKFKSIDIDLPPNFICSIGRPSYQKNTHLLINSFYEVIKQIPNTHLVIVGVGHHSPDLNEVEELIQELKLNNKITLIPWLGREETLNILNKSNIYISTSRYEGLPYSLIEALALSKACIVTNVDGNKDLIQNNYNGYSVEQNSNKISNKILTILKNEKLRREMEIASRKKYDEKFNIKKNIPLLEDIYLNVIK